MKKSELRKIVKEEYNSILKEDSVYWSSPLSVSWAHDRAWYLANNYKVSE